MEDQWLQTFKDRAAISDTILRFARSLDISDWEMCRTCFTDHVEMDYSDLRGEPPSTITADEFVAKRRTGLAGLKTLHQSTNHLVTIEGDEAVCISNAMIYRWSPAVEQDNSFHTAAIYTHHLHRTPDGWKIDRVKQTVIWNTGNPSLHGGVRREPPASE